MRLAIDDFGTGYSALSYLGRFPFDILKIDRSFVRDLAGQTERSALARTIISLGATLRLETIAEGIETSEQLDQLQAFGCTLGQGFLFAHPFPAAEVEALLARGGSATFRRARRRQCPATAAAA